MTHEVSVTTSSASPGDVDTLLGTSAARSWWRRPASWVALTLSVITGLGGFAWQAQQKANAAPSFTTEAVRRGSLSFAVTANGTLQPTRSVNIGSELSGTVARVLVDVNDRVHKGQVLVELDTAKLRDQIVRSRATLAGAQAKVAQSVATVKEAQGNFARLEEVARLSGGKVPSKAELEAGRAALERAQADETSARATVADARAALSTDETNLSKASIRSPIDGVVLTRSVDPGNAVAATLQAVTLFTIAEDLAKLRLQVNVDEADVGSVVVGQKASFTVSAYPSRRYPATVMRVAYGSTTTDNVVTYTAVLEVDNADLSLRPGMTATSSIMALERRDVLLVPNTALRFTPNVARGASPAAPRASGGADTLVSKLVPRPPRGMGRRSGGAGADTAGASRQVWVLREGRAVPLTVTTGVSDGRVTEVGGTDLQPGMQVITDQTAGAA